MGVATIFQHFRPEIGVLTSPVVILDAAITEDHGVENDVTAEPVEDLGFRTDGAVTRPRVVTLVGVISSHNPVNRGPRSGDFTIAGVGLGLSRLSNETHIRDWAKLVQIFKLRMPIDIVTRLERYRNCLPTILTTTRTKQDGASLVISATFQEMQVALVDDLANASANAAAGGGAVEDLGAQGILELPGAGL